MKSANIELSESKKKTKEELQNVNKAKPKPLPKTASKAEKIHTEQLKIWQIEKDRVVSAVADIGDKINVELEILASNRGMFIL